LNAERLQELALCYVGKYATTRAKLRAYLSRKLRERGWDGTREPDLDGLASRLGKLGYVDDAAYALSTSRALAARGYGKRRLSHKLRIDGVGEEDGGPAITYADAEAANSALRFAKRRRLGPFAPAVADPRQREKWIVAMVRAGHGFALARAIAELPPGAEVDFEAVAERFGLT
jgi:regulatory protein